MPSSEASGSFLGLKVRCNTQAFADKSEGGGAGPGDGSPGWVAEGSLRWVAGMWRGLGGGQLCYSLVHFGHHGVQLCCYLLHLGDRGMQKYNE